MKETNSNPEDARLHALLRESRPAPALPPRFQENVWRRIEHAEGPARPAVQANWLDALTAWLLRPKLAFAAAAALVLAGVWFGVNEGAQSARHEAQDRYLAAVAPGVLR